MSTAAPVPADDPRFGRDPASPLRQADVSMLRTANSYTTARTVLSFSRAAAIAS